VNEAFWIKLTPDLVDDGSAVGDTQVDPYYNNSRLTMEDTPTASPASAVPVESKKCGTCQKRVASKGCVISCCVQCCDNDTCEKHLQIKEKQRWKEQVLSGTTEIQKLAREKQLLLLHKKRFREPGFKYVGDTVVIWSIYEYAQNNKWREDAIRRSNRRKAREQDSLSVPSSSSPSSSATTATKTSQDGMKQPCTIKPVRSSNKRFRRIFDKLYQESMMEKKSEEH
jgi:hypothetical protein